jgi:hypothetical protein
MKLALIPPVGHEQYMKRTNMQMALAWNPCMQSVVRTATLTSCSERYDHVILDNGANEGAVATAKQLRIYGDVIGAHELVLPDRLDSHERTITMVKQFLRVDAATCERFYKLMAVVQGTNEASLMTCLEAFAKLDKISTIGIPRRIIDNLKDPMARINLCHKIKDEYGPRFEIHLLGAHPAYPKEIYFAAKYTSARSMDTSLPFNYALAKKKVDIKGNYKRPENYFMQVRDMSTSLVDYNINKMLEWASGKTSPTG